MSAITETLGAAHEPPPILAFHATLGIVERHLDPSHINRIANHPSVHRWVAGYALGRLDFSNLIADRDNVALMGEHGGIVFVKHQDGFYEAHTQVMPEGRGAWTKTMTEACLHIMFTQYDAVEIVTRVPKGNLGARVLTKMMGFSFEFTRSAELGGWIVDGDPVPADVFSLTIQEWMRRGPGLVERGQWFHRRLDEEFARFGVTENHPDDLVHDRYVGVACEMALSGRPFKGMIFYNRWASISGYQPIGIASMPPRPLVIDIGSAVLCFRGGDFWMMSSRLVPPAPEPVQHEEHV